MRRFHPYLAAWMLTASCAQRIGTHADPPAADVPSADVETVDAGTDATPATVDDVTPRCADGACTLGCAPGTWNCDDDLRNGCESHRACPSVMLSGFGGSTGYGPDAQCVHPSDNGAYAGPGAREGDPPVPVDLSPAFPDGLNIRGIRPQAMFVNINGAISFGQPLVQGTPSALPVRGQAIIAPWWADVDTRGGAQPARNNVCFVRQPGRVVVTWDRVGYFDRHDDRSNSFQLVVRTDPEACPRGSPIVEFRYARCGWTRGDASGEAHALAGLDTGTGHDYIALPVSLSPAVASLCTLSNVPGGPPGLFSFILRRSGC